MTDPFVATNVVRSFRGRGVVRELPSGNQTLVVSHEAIPGFMPKMTMEFTVRNTNELSGMQAGDVITFEVKATSQESWIENLRKAGTAQAESVAPPDLSPSALLHAGRLKPGDVLLDAELMGEDGQIIRFSDFKGQAVALTFIFTRCPLPDFCPRLNHNFSQARALMWRNSGGPTNWQFLSISFDAAFDKPALLRAYRNSYSGGNGDRWRFAAASPEVLAKLGPEVDFRFTSTGGSFSHNLRTVVLDPQCRVYKQFDGNKWTAEELATALTEAANVKP